MEIKKVMRKWNNAEIVSLEINATANGAEYWDQEAIKYQKAKTWYEDDLRVEVGPSTSSVVADSQS